MLDHVGFAVTDAEHSRAFYEAALAPIGIALIMTATPNRTEAGGTAHGFGSNGKPFFWVGDNGDSGANDPRSSAAMPGGHGDLITVGEGTHVAFAVETRALVDAFYAAAMAAGGRDHGPPGLRPHYHPDYYAAFVLDPDGNNIEAVCHKDLQHDREANLHHRL
jgi:catechol 2,3-dioxygenase-like lactoylglutathione lyase family enzyme